MHRIGSAYVGALLVLAAAGCGGGGGTTGYSLAATRTCLQKAGYEAAALANRFLPGSGGNLRVKLTNAIPLLDPTAPSGRVQANAYVYVVFAKDRATALATEDKAVTLALKSLSTSGLLMTRASAKAGMQVTKNVFYYSDTGALTADQRTKISRCLR